MSTIWQTITWDVARAGGFTAYILLTLAVAVGLALSTQLQSPRRWPRLLNSELHNFLTLLSTIFVGVHVLAVWIDPFTHFGWSAVFIPFASSYRVQFIFLRRSLVEAYGEKRCVCPSDTALLCVRSSDVSAWVSRQPARLVAGLCSGADASAAVDGPDA